MMRGFFDSCLQRSGHAPSFDSRIDRYSVSTRFPFTRDMNHS